MKHTKNEVGRVLASLACLLVSSTALGAGCTATSSPEDLGVSEADLERWAEKAGLAVKSAKTFRSPDGDKGIAVMVWSADSEKTAKRSAA